MADCFPHGDPYLADDMRVDGGLGEPSSPDTSSSVVPLTPPPMGIVDLVSDSEEEEPVMDEDGDTEEIHFSEDEEDLPAADTDPEDEHEPEIEVNHPHAILLSLNAPRPAPSFQVYRHPGGPLWMHTPRKRIPPVRPETLTFRVPFQVTAPVTEAPASQSPLRYMEEGDTHWSYPPQWAEDLRHWSHEFGIRPPYGMGTHFYDVSNGGSADRALPVMVRRISCLDAHARISAEKVRDMAVTTGATATHVHQMGEDFERMRDEVQHMHHELQGTRTALLELQERHAALVHEMEAERSRAAEARAGSSSQGSDHVIYLD